MRLTNKPTLIKLKKKNLGNKLLLKAIDELIGIIENANWKSWEDVLNERPDADLVHPDGFYFFNMHIHRTLILLEFGNNGEASVVWAGDHKEYTLNFKNNKDSIKKWLRQKGWIN